LLLWIVVVNRAVAIARRAAVREWRIGRRRSDRARPAHRIVLDLCDDEVPCLGRRGRRERLRVAPCLLAPCDERLEERRIVEARRQVGVVDRRIEATSDLGDDVVGDAVEGKR
jgi:hypothetical protein